MKKLSLVLAGACVGLACSAGDPAPATGSAGATATAGAGTVPVGASSGGAAAGGPATTAGAPAAGNGAGNGAGGIAQGGASGGADVGAAGGMSGGTDPGMTGSAGSGGSAPWKCDKPIANAQTWDDIKAAHTVPTWLKQAKLGIQIHWGLYAVPAYHNEWFFQHLYCNTSFADWTKQNYPAKSPMGNGNGPFGYKDFISMFTADKWDPKAWAEVFKKSGAAWVQLSAQHHDRFALWDSALTKWDAKDMGPKRDLVGDLAKEVRAQGLKFGVSNHIMYGSSFAYCNPDGTTPGKVGPKTPASVADLYDPAYADFYGPPEPQCGELSGDASCSPSAGFCDDWLARTKELSDKYQLDVHWFDWDGANVEGSQCMKNKLAYVRDYYAKGCAWGKEVATAGKGGVFPGDDKAVDGANIMIHDFETGGHAPAAGQEPKGFWMVDDKIGNGSWGYTTGMTYRSAASIISQMDNYTSRGGVLVLNVSPMADGTLPKEQQDILIEIGKHLGVK